MIYLLNGNQIQGQFTMPNGVTYPSNWLALSSSGERLALGFVTLTEVFPTLSAGNEYLTSYTDNLGALTRTYNQQAIAPILVPRPIKTVTANYTVKLDDHTILVDATAGNVVISLPLCSTAPSMPLKIKKIDSSVNTVTVQANGAELIYNIGGSNTLVLTSQGTAVPMHCNGSAWYINQ